MSAIVYREPYKLPAGILAVAVHGAFFALLYFGFAWQAQPSGTMSVELWQSLPDTMGAPPAQPKIEAVAPPRPEKVVEPEVTPPQPEKIIEQEIVLPDKKKVETKPVEVKPEKKKPAPTPVKKVDTKSAEKAKAEKAARVAEQAAREQAEQAALARAEQAATMGRVMDEQIGKIVSKIRRNIVMPPDVADDARAEFMVTLLPGGSVLGARLTRSSGNAAYDNAVERAILKSQPLPLPADVSLFNKFRELKLVFRPVE